MTTLLHRLVAWADSEPQSIAQRYKDKNGAWKSITAKEYCDRVYWLALYLKSEGFTPEDVGAIFSYNSPQWVHLDLAALLLGGKSAGIYPNSTQKDVLYILNHTESRFLSVQNQEYYQRIVGTETKGALPAQIKKIIVLDGDARFSPLAVSYEDALREGKKIAGSPGSPSLQALLQGLDPDAPAFMIYTSGTTGNPKGALLSQDNLVYTIDIGIRHWGLEPGGGSLFSFLPLCHIAEKIQNLGGGISLRYAVNFCSQFEKVSQELPEVEPTLLLCVPRLWEKMMEGVMDKVARAPLPRRLLAEWAFQVGRKTAVARYSNQELSLVEKAQWQVADRLVLSKVRKALGLGAARALCSGAAALPAHVAKWFHSLGLEIMEAFGQTESTGVICLTVRGQESSGTVGKPVDGIEFKLASDGEILFRGRNVFKSYFKDSTATAQVFDADGWAHTGDLAEFDSRGLIKIKGRKKEILKTSGGKMVAPLPIEEALKASPIISQVCMVGDGRKFLSALITLSEAKRAELQKSGAVVDGPMITSTEVVGEVNRYIQSVNEGLASYEQIKKFAVLAHEFTIDAGEMTPTLKMKRNVIESRYQSVINRFYD